LESDILLKGSIESKILEKYISVFDSHDLRLIYEGKFGAFDQAYSKINLIWGSKFIYSLNESADSALQHVFFKP